MSRETILIVDDVADIRYFVKAALTPEGFDVIEAANGTRALEIFRAKEPSLIILDLSIGQPDGFEVCREIRRSSTTRSFIRAIYARTRVMGQDYPANPISVLRVL